MPVVFTVQSGQMSKDGFQFYCSENGVWLTKYVPPKYLKDIGS
jgi:RNA:NAD 2''-phosphotransferase